MTSNETTTTDSNNEDTTLPSEKQGTFYNENTGHVDSRLLFPYLPLWLSVLIPHNKSLFNWGAAENAGSRVVESIYGELMRCILKRLEQLDLRVREVENSNGEGEDDQETIVKPMFPKDYTIFLNLVTFCEKLLSKRGVKEFESWLNPTIRCLIQMDRKFDGGVSGVYKLIELSLRIRSKIVEKRNDVLDLLAPFMATLLKRVTQLKDELLLSALQCVLASPDELVRRIGVSAFVPALKQSFRLGLRHNPIASFGLRTLERWSESQINVDSVLPILLPSLEPFLSLNAAAAAESEESLEAEPQNFTKKRKTQKKPNEKKSSKTEDLHDLQVHVLRLLGRLGGRNRFVTGSLEEGSQHDALKLGLRWASPETITMRSVPMSKMGTMNLVLGDLLPRVLRLATDSGHRQTKVAACELLHSMTIYIVGSDNRDASMISDQKGKLFEHLFPGLVRLATDVEPVTKKLFAPLVLQLVRWYSRPLTITIQGTTPTLLLLNAITDGVGNSSDGAIRDYCAKALAEFFKWSLKQSTQKQIRISHAVTVGSLLRRIYSLLRDPSPFKRYGAAATIGHLYV